MDNYNNLGINLFLNFLNKLGPLVEELNIRHNLLEDRIKKDVKEFNNKQVIKLTRMAFEDREEYFDVEINKLNFSIRKAEQNYQYNKVEYLSALVSTKTKKKYSGEKNNFKNINNAYNATLTANKKLREIY